LTPVSTDGKGPQDFILELYHGPTCAFKDVGARFLAGCIEVMAQVTRKKRTIIVATSGDTGGAVAGAFHRRHGVEVIILFPKGRISPRQETQLCAWGDNVRAFAVEGTFDDCQKMAKEALLKGDWLSANSINLGRIFPQMIYYAVAALTLARRNPKSLPASFIIPSGNLGNSLAALWAKKIGLPIGPVHLALNANRTVLDYLMTGILEAHPTVATLANAMDVGNPSNLERLKVLYPSIEAIRKEVSAESIRDDQIRDAIRTSELDWGQILCPHTATAAVYRKHLQSRGEELDRDHVIVSTAHPAKFETIVEPLIGHTVAVPEALVKILNQPAHSRTIQPRLEELMKNLGE